MDTTTAVTNSVLALVRSNGYEPVQTFFLGYSWSIIAIKDGRRYSVITNPEGTQIISVSLLKYRYNKEGDKIIDVERVIISHKNKKPATK